MSTTTETKHDPVVVARAKYDAVDKQIKDADAMTNVYAAVALGRPAVSGDLGLAFELICRSFRLSLGRDPVLRICNQGFDSAYRMTESRELAKKAFAETLAARELGGAS